MFDVIGQLSFGYSAYHLMIYVSNLYNKRYNLWFILNFLDNFVEDQPMQFVSTPLEAVARVLIGKTRRRLIIS